MTADYRPLILTAGFEPGFQGRLEGWRRAHYPPARNQVPAHLSLFRQLPGPAVAEIKQRVARVASETPPLAAWPVGFAAREGGVVLALRCPVLMELRAELADALHGLLGHGDRALPRLQVTLQNKAEAATARASLAVLRAEPLPEKVQIVRLLLWRYLEGPWELVVDQPLRWRR